MGAKPTDENRPRQTANDAKNAVKKPYVKPEVRHERVFETMALSCGKVQTTEFSCHHNRKAS
jgi:hypothetical protein